MSEAFEQCPECGAALPSGGSCRDNFNALLALEWEVPGGAGKLAHFYAVSSYVLQHPDSMSYSIDSITWLRGAVRSALAGDVTTEGLRQSARTGGGHVTRRPGDIVPHWKMRRWSTTVSDVLLGGVDGYAAHVESWARSVASDLDESDA